MLMLRILPSSSRVGRSRNITRCGRQVKNGSVGAVKEGKG